VTRHQRPPAPAAISSGTEGVEFIGMSALSPDTTRRLALIRLLLARAEQESRLAAPFSTDSINRLHDVAEMFLALAAQLHGKSIPRDFTGYWEALEPTLGRPLAYRAQMQRFNKLRVNLKHYGVEPAATEIAAAAAAVRGLLHDECPALFGLNLDEVSLSNFVSSAKARTLLDNAAAHWLNGDAIEAFADLSEAFDEVIRDYEYRKLLGRDQSIFTSLSSFHRRVRGGEQKQFEKTIIGSLAALDYTVMIVGLGVDLRRYGKFKTLVPIVGQTLGGERMPYERERGISRGQVEFEFCRDFVISTAIHLAEFDYDFGPLSVSPPETA